MNVYVWRDEGKIVGDDALDERIEKAFEEISNACFSVHGIAWDECHRIYVCLSSAEADLMRGYPVFVDTTWSSPQEIVARLRDWYDRSCPLRFISGCDGDGGETVFVDFIPQIFIDDSAMA